MNIVKENLEKILLHQYVCLEARQLAFEALDILHEQELSDLIKNSGGYEARYHGGSRLINSTTVAEICACGERRKIQAIKVMRTATGLGLREAKEAIEDASAPWASFGWHLP